MKNPIYKKAHKKVYLAIKQGKILKPNYCSQCGEKFPRIHSALLHAHHKDYTKLLDIIWLCVECHSPTYRRQSNTNKGRQEEIINQ